MRTFWKQHFLRRSTISGVFAFGLGVLGPPECALCAAGIYSEGGKGRRKFFRKFVPLGRGSDRSSLRYYRTLRPGDAKLPSLMVSLEVYFSGG